MKKFIKNAKVLAKKCKVTHVLLSSCSFILDSVSSLISLLHPPIKQCILNILTKCHNITVDSKGFAEKDNSLEEKDFVEAACSTKAKGFEDDEDDTEEYDSKSYQSYQQSLLEKAKCLKQEDTSHYFSSSAMLDYSDNNFSEYESEKDNDSVSTTTSVDESQLKDNDLNLFGKDPIENEYML